MENHMPLLNKVEASKFLKVSSRTLDRLHDIPRVRLSKNRVAFRPADLAAWAESRIERPVWRDEMAVEAL